MNDGGGRRLRLPALLLTLTVLATIVGCGQGKTLKVGMASDFRPFTYTENGTNKGFEVELWDAIAQKGGIRYELVPMESKELVSALKADKVDLVIAGMTVNKARKDELAFSDPYFQTGLVMATAVHNTDIKSKEDLSGKTVGTELDTTGYTYAGKLPKLKELRGYPTINGAFAALNAGEVDCIIFDERGAHNYVQNEGKDKVKIVGDVLNKETYAIAAKKRNVHIGKVNSAIEQVAGNGTYDSLYIKWFGSKPQKLPGK
ncbi:substrate-binding periplasmic protein [Paenibacillus ginsengarvi]|uniref:Glutamine ABC transporter substrate-bindnig protein n=1 Tax=Paenibacillus ginsengarvi TaxID=400777 RepID=A0A3B0BQ20_9BACL|nr:transporter substrate-binding domain-containing protein [Paenibacillus ginsengarvi]RKN74952.1 glutamine ABC transporter substrate-bindnig protein [Paenibacillus ginsengarvi]